LDDFGLRADEGDLRSFADLGKIGIFGKEAVARMDGVHIRDFRRADHVWDVQIALTAARRADAHSLVGKPDMQGIAVGLRINGHSGNAQLLQAQMTRRAISPRLATRIFWNIVRQAAYLLRLGRIPNNACPYSTGCPFSAKMRSTSPLISDSISFMSFMASTMHSVWPLSTCEPTLTNASAPGLGEA